MWRRWLGPMLLVVAVPLGWGVWRALDYLQLRGELLRARRDVSQGRFDTARIRLAALTAARPGALGGQLDYWLAVCESSLGRVDAALAAFARVPPGYVFDPQVARLEAEANLQRGRLRPAERRLEEMLKRAGPGLNPVRELLSHVYEIQLRVEDSLPLYRASLAESTDPFSLLQRISTLEGGTLPVDSLRATLDEALRMAPEDDRVWLGQARLAIQMGQWDQARSWLTRCLAKTPDVPVCNAWIDWAQGAGQPGEALEAIRKLGIENLTPAQTLAITAWLCRQAGDIQGERAALRGWLGREPRSVQALERMAALAEGPDDAASYRRRKSEIDRALDRYRHQVRLGSANQFQTTSARVEIACLADRAGLLRDAGDWFRVALAAEPGNEQVRIQLSRIDSELARQSSQVEDTGAALQELARRAALAERAMPGEVAPGRAMGAKRSPTEPEPRTSLSFIDDANAAGLRFEYRNGESKIHQIPETTGGGVGLLDFDGDGWMDVFVTQGGSFPPIPGRPSSGDRLFRNRGNGTFEDVTQRAGLAELAETYGHGVTVADYDNDGHPDLFLTRWRGYRLLRNRGDGTFENVTGRAGLGGDRDWPTSAAFADLDSDGDLDLYVCHYAVWDADNPKLCRNATSGAYISCNPLDLEARPDHLFRNDQGKFVDVTAESGIRDSDGRGLGVVAADVDEDGRVDLYVANDLTANDLWRNLGGWKFEEVGHSAGVAGNASGGYQASMGIAAGDLDFDGRIDLLVTNFYGECTTFYRNLGGGAFTDSTSTIGLDVATRRLLGFGIALLDANNDGRLDLASANGHVNDLRPHFPYLMPAQLLVSDARGRLHDVSPRAGAPWSVPRMGRGLAAGDLDNDGRVDLLLLGHNEPLAYLHNRSGCGHHVTFGLQGTEARSNRDAVGARVTISFAGQRLVAWRVGGGSYQSAGDPRMHFGLGDADRIETVEVSWPSGQVDRFHHLRADQGYLIREGSARPASLTGFARSGTESRIP